MHLNKFNSVNDSAALSSENIYLSCKYCLLVLQMIGFRIQLYNSKRKQVIGLKIKAIRVSTVAKSVQDQFDLS